MIFLDDQADARLLAMQLAAVVGIMLLVMFLMLEDIERLKRITAPRVIFIAPDQKREPAFDAPAPLTLEGEVLN